MLPDLASHRAFGELLDGLRECAERYLVPENEIEAELDLTGGLRAILHLLSAGIDFYLEGDPERPELVRMVSPTRKFLGDNPDWLDRAGPAEGLIFWRFLLPEEKPERPRCRVVPLAELARS